MTQELDICTVFIGNLSHSIFSDPIWSEAIDSDMVLDIISGSNNFMAMYVSTGNSVWNDPQKLNVLGSQHSDKWQNRSRASLWTLVRIWVINISIDPSCKVALGPQHDSRWQLIARVATQPSLVTKATDININPSYGRATDPDMATGNNLGPFNTLAIGGIAVQSDGHT